MDKMIERFKAKIYMQIICIKFNGSFLVLLSLISKNFQTLEIETDIDLTEEDGEEHNRQQ